jgi:DNA polymerase elongation subunit (family B)
MCVKREKVKGLWKKIHTEEFRSLYSSINITEGDQIKDDEVG